MTRPGAGRAESLELRTSDPAEWLGCDRAAALVRWQDGACQGAPRSRL